MTDRRSVACDCTCADQCPQGRTGSVERCRIVKRDLEPRRTFTIDSDREMRGDHRIRVAEHDDRGFVGIDAGLASHAVMLAPAQMVALAAELLAVAGNIIERQFARRLGSP